MREFDPRSVAVRWYFGEMMHEEIPQICAAALEEGYDGRGLRRLAGLLKPTSRDISSGDVDGVFREMGIAAPLSKTDAQLCLAITTARAAIFGDRNVFDAATHIRVYICGLRPEPEALSDIVRLSEESKHAPRDKWTELEQQVRLALESLAVRPDPVQ